MGGFFSSEPVTPLLTNSSNRVPQASSVSVASSIIRYKTTHHVFDIFERPPNTLDTVYEHDKEREEVRDHPVEERDSPMLIPNEIEETSQTIYYSKPLEKIENNSHKSFYDLRRIDIQPVVVTDDIVLRRQRSLRPTSKATRS